MIPTTAGGGSPIVDPFASIIDLAPSIIKGNATWADMWAAFAAVMDSNVEGPIAQLERIRYIQQDTDTTVARDTARMLGFDMSQDVLSLNAENLTKIVTQLPLYPDQNGNETFVQFIDLALNAITTVEYKYSRDYVNFYTHPKGALVINGGLWFKTTHINLTVSLKSLEELVLAPGQSLYKRVKDLFSSFAPVHLVVDHFVFVIEFNNDDWLGGTAFGIGATFGARELSVILD